MENGAPQPSDSGSISVNDGVLNDGLPDFWTTSVLEASSRAALALRSTENLRHWGSFRSPQEHGETSDPLPELAFFKKMYI